MLGLAVPVRDQDDRVVAGLALHAPVVRLSKDAALQKVETLHGAARRIGEALITENGG